MLKQTGLFKKKIKLFCTLTASWMKLGINCIRFFSHAARATQAPTHTMRQLTCLPAEHVHMTLSPPGTWHVENTGLTDFCRHPWKYLSNNLNCLWSDQQLLFLVTHGWFLDGRLNLKSVGSPALWLKTAPTEIWHNFALHQLLFYTSLVTALYFFFFPAQHFLWSYSVRLFVNLKL